MPTAAEAGGKAGRRPPFGPKIFITNGPRCHAAVNKPPPSVTGFVESLVAFDNESVPTTRPATLVRAVALGAASGSRSTAGITALALTSRPDDLGVIASRAGSRPAQVVTPLAAVGELTADKLPSTPSRLGVDRKSVV